MDARKALTWVAIAAGVTFMVAVGLQGSRPKERAKSEEATPPMVTAPGHMFPVPGTSIHFLDDDRIVYFGASDAEYDQLMKAGLRSIRVWNWRTGDVRDIGTSNLLALCAEGDTIRYVHREGDNVIIKQGTIEQMAETRVPVAKRAELIRHNFHCREYHPDEIGPEGRCWIALRDGDGYIDANGRACKAEERDVLLALRARAGSDRLVSDQLNKEEQELRDRPALYYRTPTSEPIALPFTSFKLGGMGHAIRYAPFAGTYAIREREPFGQDIGAADYENRVWLLKPDGTATLITVPADRRLGVASDVQLSARGTLVRSSRVGLRGPIGDAGLYLLDSSQTLSKLIAAYSQEMQVSPNGCNVALHTALYPQGARAVEGRVNVLSLCLGQACQQFRS